MRGCLLAVAVVVMVGVTSATADAQVVVHPRAHVVYSPVVPAYPPVVVHHAPVAMTVAPVVVTQYAPTVVNYVPAAPTVVYQPIVTTVPAPVYVPVGRPVIVRPKVYVPGQPVRNVFRAITP
jgi:hypothetical protein